MSLTCHLVLSNDTVKWLLIIRVSNLKDHYHMVMNLTKYLIN